MKLPLLVLVFLLLALLGPPAGRRVRPRRGAGARAAYGRHLLPLHVVRTAQPPKTVRAVN